MPRSVGRSYQGVFGGLHVGVAEPAAPHGYMRAADGVEFSDINGVNSRPGMRESFRVREWASSERQVYADDAFGIGNIPKIKWTWGAGTGTNMHLCVTFVTAAGETRSWDPRTYHEVLSAAGMSESDGVSFVSKDADSVTIAVPFNMRGLQVVGQSPDRTKIYVNTDDMPSHFADAFKSFHVFSRSPVIQDETELGANPDALPMDHTTEPLAIVTAYDDTEKSFTLDRPIPNLLSSGIPESARVVDILLPADDTLRPLYFNVYASNGDGFPLPGMYWQFSGVDGRETFTLARADIVESGTKAPHERCELDAPTVTATDATYLNPDTGKTEPISTGIRGGEYIIYYTWNTSRRDLIQPPGWDSASAKLGIEGPQPEPQGTSETWLSTGTFVNVNDGQQINITLPDFPTGVRSANIYAYYGNGTQTVDVEGASIMYFGDQDLVSDPDVWRAGATVATAGEYSQVATENSGNGSLMEKSGKTEFQITPNIRLAFSTLSVHNTSITAEIRVRKKESCRRDGNMVFRYWNESTESWVTLKTLKINSEDKHTGFPVEWVTHRLCFPASESTTSLADPVSGNWILDFQPDDTTNSENFGYYLDYFQSESSAAEIFSKALLGSMFEWVDGSNFKQRETTSTTCVLDKPLAIFRGTTARNGMDSCGELSLYSAPLSGDSSRFSTKSKLVVGIADSVFVQRGSRLQRIYSERGSTFSSVCRSRWRFANYKNRVFIYNDGKSDGNLVFDGRHTRPMGFHDPPELAGVADLVQAPPSGEETGTYEGEYYIAYKRVNPFSGRSYVVRSRPVQFTNTITIPESEYTDTVYRLSAELRLEPAVTHIEVYRSKKGTGEYFLTKDIPVAPSSSSRSYTTRDGIFHLEFDDVVDDTRLGRQAEFETGRPPSAAIMHFSDERCYIVPKDELEVVRYSRISSTGKSDPEGFYALDAFDPRSDYGAPAIRALAPYGTGLLAHTDDGPFVVTGDVDNPGWTKLFGDVGAVGQNAWANSGSRQYGMSRKGPFEVLGSEVKYIGKEVERYIEKANFSARAVDRMRVINYKSQGKTQILFSYCERGSDIPTHVLVFDPHATSGNEDGSGKWSRWPLRVADMVTSDTSNEEDYLFLATEHGSMDRFGLGQTDNGMLRPIFIETMALDLTGHGSSFRPDVLYIKTSGKRGHKSIVELQRGYENDQWHTYDQYLDMGVGGDYYWGDFTFGQDATYEEFDESNTWSEARMKLGRDHRQFRLRIRIDYDDLPPGVPPDVEFRSSGFEIWFRQLGKRYFPMTP